MERINLRTEIAMGTLDNFAVVCQGLGSLVGTQTLALYFEITGTPLGRRWNIFCQDFRLHTLHPMPISQKKKKASSLTLTALNREEDTNVRHISYNLIRIENT
jgi:hypothetical protein